MKKFILTVSGLMALAALAWYAHYGLGYHLPAASRQPVQARFTTEGDAIWMEREGKRQPFEIRAVDLGASLPGQWGTDYAIDQETYLRWFAMIQDLGANTLRIAARFHGTFYRAFHTYNTRREAAGLEPLWLLQGLWVDDYAQNSHQDFYASGLLPQLMEDGKAAVDAIHGKKFLLGRDGEGSGYYTWDVSPWVLGYLLGGEWEAGMVTYTNQIHQGEPGYQGRYLATTPEATPFETALAKLGDGILDYESRRYGEQRLVAVSNGVDTDPFRYSLLTSLRYGKYAAVNAEHIQPTEALRSGLFVSYHVYPDSPDYVQAEREALACPQEEVDGQLGRNQAETLRYRLAQWEAPSIQDFLTPEEGGEDQKGPAPYTAYVEALNRFHTIPVLISGYGGSTGRGQTQEGSSLTEQEQGEWLIACYQAIRNGGSAGSCLFSWQDEWFRRSWNTQPGVDLLKSPYWSDVQTQDQFYGLLTFDPGREESVCLVDGTAEEWTEADRVWGEEGLTVSVKYDEKFLYCYVEGFDLDRETLYLPLDVTPRSGSETCGLYGLRFDRPCDFLVVLDGRENSRVLVQERYEVLPSVFWAWYGGEDPYLDPPAEDSPRFVPVEQLVDRGEGLLQGGDGKTVGLRVETGKLRYGNAHPAAPDFDSLADVCATEGGVELRLPWQLLNFSNPSEGMIHDDYYACYGVENLPISALYVGAALAPGEKVVRLSPVTLKGWGTRVTYHERRKASYGILQQYWADLDGRDGREEGPDGG